MDAGMSIGAGVQETEMHIYCRMGLCSTHLCNPALLFFFSLSLSRSSGSDDIVNKRYPEMCREYLQNPRKHPYGCKEENCTVDMVMWILPIQTHL